MNDDRDRGLEDVWPRVRAEIESARRRVRLRKAAWLAVQAGAVWLVAAVLWALWTRQTGGLEGVDSHPWQLGDISAATDIAVDYPLARGRRLFVVQGSGDRQHLACVERRSGTVAWRNALVFSECRLAADDRRVYLLASARGGPWFCAAFEAGTGAELWNQPLSGLGGRAPSTLAVVPGGLAWTVRGRATVLDRSTGELRWSREVGSNHLLSAPVALGEVLWVASRDRVHALDLETGEPRWSQALALGAGLDLHRPLLEASGGRVFCAARDMGGFGTLWCVDARSGSVLWHRPTGLPLKLNLQGGRVFVRSQALRVFDGRTGRALWQVSVGGCGSVSFGQDRVYLVDARRRGRVMALDGRTGRNVWARSLAASCNGIVVRGPMGFLSGNDRTLYAFPLYDHS